MRAWMTVCALALLLAAFAPLSGYARPATDTVTPPIDDALVPPDRTDAVLASGELLRGPSEYMVGTVAVRLVLPESDGSIDPDSERWTDAQIAEVQTQVQMALDWWTSNMPLADLSFELHTEVVPTAYEPINYGLADEGRWIGDTLGRLGFKGSSYFDQAYAAGDGLRDELGTDWTTTIFIVNSANHGTGHFADGRFAYAYINGPFMVMTSDAGSYGTSRLAPVVAHELGHIFGALDQYAAARVSCDRRSGYLDTPTSNSQYGGCGGQATSIMLEPLAAFARNAIDDSARAQVGYRDSDHDGLIDPLDTAPAIVLDEGRVAAGTGRPVLRGTTRDVPFPSEYHQDVTLNTIRAVEYRVNGGLWQPLAAEDGAYDEATERFFGELPLYNGDHNVELRAINSAGAVSGPVTRRIVISWIGPQPTYTLETPVATASPTIALSLGAPAATRGVQVSEDVSFSGAAWQSYTSSLPYVLSGADGPRTLYVRFRDSLGLVSLAYALPITLDTQPPVGWATRDPHDHTVLVSVAHDDGSGVTELEVRVGVGEPVWQPYAERVPLPAGAEQTTVSVRFRDLAGNVSPAYEAPRGYRVSLPLVVK